MLGDVMSNAENVVAKGRLGPGQMVCADLEAGTFAENAAISKAVATRQPYKEWVAQSVRRLEDLSPVIYPKEAKMDNATLLRLEVRGWQHMLRLPDHLLVRPAAQACAPPQSVSDTDI